MLMQPIAPIDPVFPGLADALDPARAAKAFQAALIGHDVQLGALECRIERARIKRGRKVVIGYRLTGSRADRESFDQPAMVALWPQGNPQLLKDMGGAIVPSKLGPGTAAIEDIGGQAWFFPNDRKVHGIGTLLDAIPESVTQGMRVEGCEVIHYVPEQGCTVRVALSDGRVAYGKARVDDRGAVAARIVGMGRIRLAPVLHHDAKHRILWQAGLAGQPVEIADIVARPAFWAPRFASTIAAFHECPPPDGLKRLTVDSLSETLGRRAERTALAMPVLADDIFRLARRIGQSQPGDLPLVLSHCDLHPANLLWDGQGFALIDLDTCALAPAALDFGSLTAALVHAAIEGHARDSAILGLAGAFRAEAGVEAFYWFVAASLLGERLYRCGTRLKSPSLRSRVRLIEIASQLLDMDRG